MRDNFVYWGVMAREDYPIENGIINETQKDSK